MNSHSHRPFLLVALHGMLTACALVFACTLFWNGQARMAETPGASAAPAPSLDVYAPSFTVRADTVRTMRVTPLAGSSLRSLSVDPVADQAVTLLY